MKSVVCIMLLSFTLAGGCKYVVHPGSVSTVDSKGYDVLLAAQTTIEASRTEMRNNNRMLVPLAFVQLEKSYNVAYAAWHAYHDGVLAKRGADPAQLQKTLSTALTDLTAALSAFKKGKK